MGKKRFDEDFLEDLVMMDVEHDKICCSKREFGCWEDYTALAATRHTFCSNDCRQNEEFGNSIPPCSLVFVTFRIQYAFTSIDMLHDA